MISSEALVAVCKLVACQSLLVKLSTVGDLLMGQIHAVKQ
jgi:hypothetical protein